jgi:ATP-binding cassette subfamily C protein CydCD
MTGRGGGARQTIIDPRLWRHVSAFRRWVAGVVLLGLGLTACLVGQATFLAAGLTDLLFHRADHGALRAALLGLVVATAARGALSFFAEWAAARAAAKTKAELRTGALAKAMSLGPVWLAGQSTGELAVTLGHGLDALDDYIGRYLPAAILAVLAPVMLLGWIAHLDLLSAGILVVTMALLPVFMVLTGQRTKTRVAARWRTLTRLSGQFLDAVEGLATLRAFGRAQRQRGAIAEATGDLRRATLKTLQVAFLSALILETLAAVGTALVAVPLGLRLLSGDMTLAPALTILILTPEVYLPLRRASADYHAGAEGLAALQATFALIDQPSRLPVPDLGHAGDRRGAPGIVPGARRVAEAAVVPPSIELQAVSVCYPGRSEEVLARCTLAVAPGEHLGVTGPSGAGKSSLIAVVTGLVNPCQGKVLLDGVELAPAGAAMDLQAWRNRLTWVPQRPALFSGTVADNLRLGAPGASDAQLWAALDLACLADVIAGLPGGLQARVREHAEDLSAGERQRLALARALVRRHAGLVLLDEPTAHLDPGIEQAVADGLRDALSGRSAIIVTHRRRLLELTDRVISLDKGTVVAAGAPGLTAVAAGRGKVARA